MCRMLGIYSIRQTSAYAPLVETDKSLWRQSFSDPKQKQRDGWGIAWYGSTAPGLKSSKPAIFRSARPLPDQRGLFGRKAVRTRGQIILCHIRRASNPRGLPLARIRGLKNVQPFQDGNWTFMHNGSIPFPDETSRTPGSIRRRIRGLNDSEVVFWALRHELHRTHSVPSALRNLRKRLKAIHARFAGSGPKKERRPLSPHRGLNIMITNGEALWAYAEAPATQKRPRPRAICSPDWPYYQMAFLPDRDRVMVSSEPLWSGGRWKPVRSGEILEIGQRKGRVVWRKYQLSPTS